MVLCALALIVTAAVAVTLGVKPCTVECGGMLYSLQGPLLGGGTLSAAANVLCLLVTGAVMLALNKVFTFVRSVTRLFVSAFFLLQVAHPSGLVALHAGTLLCLVAALSLLPLFASFQDRHSQRSIFLVFALAAAGVMFHYGFLVLMLAFMLGFFMMGVFNLKGLLAMLFGLVTPFWIVFGLGLASPAGFTPPHVNGVWWLGRGDFNVVLALAAATAVLGFVLAIMNLHTIMNYRLQPRVYNIFFFFALVFTVIAMCVDCGDVAVYLPLLNLVVGVQIAHSHTLRTGLFRYVFPLLLIAGCFGFAAAHMMMP